MAEAKKKAGSKGAPAPRSKRGRTINRRRERFIRSQSKKVAKLTEARKEITIGTGLYDELTKAINVAHEAILASKAAQSARVARVAKK
jgi:hypothetical protein